MLKQKPSAAGGIQSRNPELVPSEQTDGRDQSLVKSPFLEELSVETRAWKIRTQVGREPCI